MREGGCLQQSGSGLHGSMAGLIVLKLTISNL